MTCATHSDLNTRSKLSLELRVQKNTHKTNIAKRVNIIKHKRILKLNTAVTVTHVNNFSTRNQHEQLWRHFPETGFYSPMTEWAGWRLVDERGWTWMNPAAARERPKQGRGRRERGLCKSHWGNWGRLNSGERPSPQDSGRTWWANLWCSREWNSECMDATLSSDVDPMMRCNTNYHHPSSSFHF